MRNLVAKNDFNRASVHADRSKEPQDSVEEGLLEYLAQTSENDAQAEYGRHIAGPSAKLYICGNEISTFADAALVATKTDQSN
ncbi:hypothetical protein CHUUTOTORO_00580 [Serratia phage vB_SmaM-ChuuTotoro]|nr:hypothetical protein CHUUTOTORO_00580 [Serratia phage vB_SmaM-ChuuTotoro]